MLMRKGTLEMAKEIEDISLGRQSKAIRRVFVGERGSGKTVMLLQAMTMAFLKGWVVINIPTGMFGFILYHLSTFSFFLLTSSQLRILPSPAQSTVPYPPPTQPSTPNASTPPPSSTQCPAQILSSNLSSSPNPLGRMSSLSPFPQTYLFPVSPFSAPKNPRSLGRYSSCYIESSRSRAGHLCYSAWMVSPT